MDDFWIQWNRKFSKRTKSITNINGYYHNEDIANVFCDTFSSAQFNSHADSHQLVGCLNKVRDKILCDSSTQNINLFDVIDVKNVLASLKLGKAAGYDGLTMESLHYCHPVIFIHLKLLFNMMSVPGYVPDDFGVGVVVPVVKDQCADLCSADSHCPVTLSAVVSKVFESCVLQKYGDMLYSDNMQFGFKKHSSWAYALIVMSQVADYFLCHGNSVYMASLNASKAFDRVNHVR